MNCLFVAIGVLSLLCSTLSFQVKYAGSSSSRLGFKLSMTSVLPEVSNVVRNENFAKLQAGYLFPEIGRRRNAYLAQNPDAKIISLGIGDTTQPIPEHILGGLKAGAAKLGTAENYTGYGAEQGVKDLREKIASKLYNNLVAADEVFVSDGAKCDISRLMMMFGAKAISAVQDPSYPVYVDTAVMIGQTGEMDKESSQFKNIIYMPCNPENNFFPDVTKLPRADVYYFCSPNNPTGAVASREQLEGLVKYAKENGSIIVFDAAYAPFIRTPGRDSNCNFNPNSNLNFCLI
jgi:LL-diaminopimelate aminotransferase